MLIRQYATAAAGFCALTFLCPFDAAGQFDVEVQEAPAVAAPAPAAGPQRIIRGPDGKPMVVQPGQQPMPPGEAKPGGDPSKPDEKKDGKPGEPKVVARPTEPPEKPDPDELKVDPDGDGMLRFNFRNQPWVEVLEWLARVSDKSLDWLEVPGGFLNLSTQRAYTVEETRDLINRHLLARGYTMLQNGEVLSIAKISEINSGMVPRVSADELETLMPHQFAKVSFKLEWLLAEEAVEELKPMKSPNGTLTALKNTNRIEAMDAVINLREIYHLLEQEQSESGQDNLIQEFVLEHARATDVLASLEELLGLESKQAAAAPMNPQQMQQMQQMMQQQQQQMQQRGGAQPGAAPKKPGEVHLIVNSRKNSVVAHAPPDKMALIERAVQALDVATSHRDGLLNKPFQIHAYRLHSLSPGPLVKTLQDVGDLDPNTRLEADEKSKSIVAYASLVDHATIQQLIDNLDGSGRQFEVLQLRRLAADYVAGTIEFMMIGEKEEQQQPRYYSYYSGRSESEQTTDGDEFRVDADVENNMLLLWANAIEIEAVRNLLVKLGEIPPEGGRTSTMRVLNVVPPEEAAKFLERLRQAWPSLAPNDLNLPTLPEEKEQTEPKPSAKPSEPEAKEARHRGNHLTLTVLDASEQDGEETVEPDDSNAEPPQPPERAAPPTREELRRLLFEGQRERSATPPPVSVSIDPAGRLIITSQDTNALDLLEELVSQLAPPAADYKIFKLLHVDAYYVKDNLEDFFKEEDDDKAKNSNRRYYYYDYYSPQKEEKSRSRLSQRPKLKFIYDYDSNTILVQGASAEQLATIEELIAIYDKPETDDSQSARLSAVFQIEYSKATVIAEAIKDVYRDLLSDNDKSLQQQGNPEAKNRQPSGSTYIFNDGESDDKPDRTHLSFKGKLSIGIDEVSNVLLVSAEGEQLMKSVEVMIETLDKAARPVSTVSVVQLGGNLNAQKVREVLAGLLGDKQAPAQPAGENAQANAQRGNPPRGNNPQNNAAAPTVTLP
ncbi:MAG: hypothetical protein O3C40_07325 [Planctomycetota bacterium]|nr:hypothetical protein [Planctomycetota bacterium]